MATSFSNISDLFSMYCECLGISTDTRKIDKNTMFFCLKGTNFDGNAFAKSALEQGAKYVVIDNAEFDCGENSILVENVLDTLQQLAHFYRMKFDIPVIGITGTNGKTTTKELVNAVLSSKFKTHATKGNLNNHIGVPLTLLSMPLDTEIAIIEMGANHLNEIDELCQIASPNIGLITSIGKAHLEGFGSLAGIIKTKKELFDYIENNNGELFVSADNELLMNLSQSLKRTTYGQSHHSKVKGELGKNEGLLNLNFETENIQTQLVGDYNFANIMAAIALGKHFGINNELIKKSLEAYEPQNQRSQLMVKGSNTLVIDAYNANPTSMELALQSLANANFKYKSAILGDMLELGAESIVEHQHIVDLLLDLKLETVLLIGPVFCSLKSPFLSFENSELAKNYLKDKPMENQYILIKGSRGIQVEKVLDVL